MKRSLNLLLPIIYMICHSSSEARCSGMSGCERTAGVSTVDKLLEISRLKKKVLSAVGISQRPPKSRHLSGDELREISNDFHTNEELIISSLRKRSISEVKLPLNDKTRRVVSGRALSFVVEGCHREERCVLEESTLKVYFKMKARQREVQIRLHISHDKESITQTLKLSQSAWHEFDVKKITRSWLLQSGRRTRTVRIKCYGCKGKVKPILKTRMNRNILKKPKLIWRVNSEDETSPGGNKRPKYCSENDKFCCLRQKVVDFREIGWNDWIVMPRRIPVNQCSGVCDLNRVKHSAHAQLFARMHRSGHVTSSRSRETPCCVPTKLRAVSVLLHEDSVIRKNDLDLVVEECGCA